MRLSITVPAYQVEQYLPKCLDSLLSQSLRDLEVIVVDDGSTDSTGRICDSFAASDRRVRVIHQANKGLVSARKAAAAIASAPYIACVDGDDYVDFDYCERLLDLAGASNADVVVGGHIRDYRDARQFIPPSLPPGVYRGDGMREVLSVCISRPPFFTHGISTYLWGKLFRTHLYREAQQAVPDHLTIGEDAACVYPIVALSSAVAVSDSCGYHYIQRQSSMLKARADRVPAEVAKMSNLMNFIRARMLNEENVELLRQLDEYELSQILIRSGGVSYTTAEELLVFGRRVQRGAKLSIYSAGTFGQVMFNRIQSSKFADVAYWVDEDWQEYRKDGLPVVSESALPGDGFDAVVIASLSPAFVSSARKRLSGLGVPDSKVVSYSPPQDIGSELSSLRKLARTFGPTPTGGR
jgi:glycosyltransferase involved in cell wall biosynthesis